MEITAERMMHSLEVAKKMKRLATENAAFFGVSPDDAFILGLLHDVGYEYCNEQAEHARVGGMFLKEQGYKYWKEVYYHGIVQDEYSSNMLLLLNYVDMTTGPNGENMTIPERIEDISERYGAESWQTVEAQKLVGTFISIDIN